MSFTALRLKLGLSKPECSQLLKEAEALDWVEHHVGYSTVFESKKYLYQITADATASLAKELLKFTTDALRVLAFLRKERRALTLNECCQFRGKTRLPKGEYLHWKGQTRTYLIYLKAIGSVETIAPSDHHPFLRFRASDEEY